MVRKAVNPNVDTPPAPHARGTEWATAGDEAEREAIREETRTTAAALDEAMTMREADARRDVPRLRTDAANPNMDRSLPAAGAVRGMLSSNRKKDYSKRKREWVQTIPKTRHNAMSRTMTDRVALEGVNRELNNVTGVKSELKPAIRRRIEHIDAAISDFERTNPREHVVYATLKAPFPRQPSREALRDRLERMAQSGSTMTFDSYIPSTHSLGTVSETPDIVMEIKTRSGAYLGSSDTTTNADHLVGRGRTLRPVAVTEATYVKPDGTRGSRIVVQMEDVTAEERTVARS